MCLSERGDDALDETGVLSLLCQRQPVTNLAYLKKIGAQSPHPSGSHALLSALWLTLAPRG